MRVREITVVLIRPDRPNPEVLEQVYLILARACS